MPILKSERSEKRIVLPSSTPEDEAWAIVYTDLRTGDIFSTDPTQQTQRTTPEIVANLIKDWNFLQANGEKAPITSEFVALLDAVDLVYILKETGVEGKMRAFTDAKKKNSSSTSPETQM